MELRRFIDGVKRCKGGGFFFLRLVIALTTREYGRCKVYDSLFADKRYWVKSVASLFYFYYLFFIPVMEISIKLACGMPSVLPGVIFKRLCKYTSIIPLTTLTF